jgi:hypothetical protein
MFRFELAEALGKFPHEIDEMPQEDFVAFMIKNSISPLLSKRIDVHTSFLLHQQAAINRNPKKPFNKLPADYQIYRYTPAKKPQTEEEIEKAIHNTLSRV